MAGFEKIAGYGDAPDWAQSKNSVNGLHADITPYGQDDYKKKLPPGAEISIWNAAAAYQG